MAWYGRRRSGEPRTGARAVVVGIALAMVGLLAIQTSGAVKEALQPARRSMDAASAFLVSRADGVSGFRFGIGGSRETQERIEALEKEVRDLQRWKDLAETMVLRMRRYEELLDLMGETEGDEITARIVAEMDSPFAASRIVNAGARDGVQEGYAVVNENGLVGRVVRVGERTSRVLLVTDFNSRIPVMGSLSQDRALLVGDRGGGGRLLEPETPDRIVEGEMWVTSGDDGQTPLGVRVGRARLDGGQWRLDLQLMAAPVDFVRLVPPPDLPAPELAPVIAPPVPGPAPATAPAPVISAAPAGEGQ
jgi:rod shape-determining protein MreC